MRKYAVTALILLLVLVACESEATPFPVDIPPTETPVPVPTEIPPIRYALAANTNGFVADIDVIRSGASVEQLTE